MRRILRRATLALRRRGYDPVAYWSSREDPNVLAGKTAEHIDRTVRYIREQCGDAASVLELGPGVGRTLDAHPAHRAVTAYDISTRYRERLLARAAELGISVSFHLAESVTARFPFPDGAFPVGVACQVLQHQRPDQVRHVVAELVRCCARVIVIVAARQLAAPHVYLHDYPKLASKLGCELNHVRVVDDVYGFVVEPIENA